MDLDSNAGQQLRSSRSIQEFWIDFLLEEEFSVDSTFASTFLAACGSSLEYRSTESTAHSVSDKYGEADLVVRLIVSQRTDQKPRRLALLIEDKITAGFQPYQAERYRKRGEEGKQAGYWDCYVTVLVAPQAYIPSTHDFDAAVSLEQVEEWICLNDAVRRQFKLRRIRQAIEKKNTTGVQVVDQGMTKFRAAYYDLLQRFNGEHSTDFFMREPKETYYGDTWFNLKSAQLPPSSEIRHMAPNGNIELTFKKTNFDKCRGIADVAEAQMPGVKVIRTGKHLQHVTLRMSAPRIDAFDDFEKYRGAVEQTLVTAKELWNLFLRNRAAFESVLNSARQDEGR